MHPWTALGQLSAAALFAWFLTRDLRKPWYPRHAIGIIGLAITVICLTVGYCAARYDDAHVNRGVPE